MATAPLEDLSGTISLINKHPDKIGQFSDFFFAKWKTPIPGRPKWVGAKRLRGGQISDKEFLDEFNETFTQHANRWTKFNHPNVALCYGYAFDLGPMPAIIMDNYENGTIIEYLKTKEVSFDEKLQLVTETAEGLNYLHTREPPVIHGDLRAANVFVDNRGHAVIADYELVHIIGPQDFTSYKPAGTARWIGPEFITAGDDGDDDYGGPKFSKASDVYAFAMTAIEVFTGEVPFASNKQDIAVMRLVSEGKRPDIPHEVIKHKGLKELIEKCWDKDPALRPNTRDIIDALNKDAQPPVQASYLGYAINYIRNLFNSLAMVSL